VGEEAELLQAVLAETRRALQADALDDEADGGLAQMVSAGQAKLAAFEEELQAKLEAQRVAHATELAAIQAQIDELDNEFSDAAGRRRQKLQSQVAIEEARLAGLQVN
jgi:predicted signal transduction protein with EAL and GGDEF domain